jgi:hypothetical protein
LLSAYSELEKELVGRPLAVTGGAIGQAGVSAAVAWYFTQQMLPEVVPARDHPALREFSAKAEALPEFAAAPYGDSTYRPSR